MKITKKELERLIQEELEKMTLEEGPFSDFISKGVDKLKGAFGAKDWEKEAEKTKEDPEDTEADKEPESSDSEKPVDSAMAQDTPDDKKSVKPQVFSVEKGKSSLQQQLMKKYASQIGPEATKFINAIARDIKADLAASGVQVQENIEQIGSTILNELLEEDRDVRILFEEATQEDVSALRAEIAKLEKAMKSAPPEAKKFQERELEKLKAKRDAAVSDLIAKAERKAAEKAAAEKKAAVMKNKVAKDTAAQKMQNMQQGRMADKQKADLMKKALQTKRVSKPGVVDVNQAVQSKLAALKKLNPKLAKKIDTITPQVMKAVTNYVNYVLKASGKSGEVRVASKLQQSKPAVSDNKEGESFFDVQKVGIHETKRMQKLAGLLKD